MRTIEGDAPEDTIAVGSVDWKEEPSSVLESIDKLLAQYGLEVVVFDDGSDSIAFAIEPKRDS